MAIPLALVQKGKKVKIKKLVCGRRLMARLLDLGIMPNSKIKVIQNDVSGPLIVKVLESKLIIERGKAHKILVEEMA